MKKNSVLFACIIAVVFATVSVDMAAMKRRHLGNGSLKQLPQEILCEIFLFGLGDETENGVSVVKALKTFELVCKSFQEGTKNLYRLFFQALINKKITYVRREALEWYMKIITATNRTLTNTHRTLRQRISEQEYVESVLIPLVTLLEEMKRTKTNVNEIENLTQKISLFKTDLDKYLTILNEQLNHQTDGEEDDDEQKATALEILTRLYGQAGMYTNYEIMEQIEKFIIKANLTNEFKVFTTRILPTEIARIARTNRDINMLLHLIRSPLITHIINGIEGENVPLALMQELLSHTIIAAVKDGSTDILTSLLNHQWTPLLNTHWANRILVDAIASKNNKMVKLVLNHIENRITDFGPAMLCATKTGNTELFFFLYKKEKQVSPKYAASIFKEAIMRGNEKIFGLVYRSFNFTIIERYDKNIFNDSLTIATQRSIAPFITQILKKFGDRITPKQLAKLLFQIIKKRQTHIFAIIERYCQATIKKITDPEKILFFSQAVLFDQRELAKRIEPYLPKIFLKKMKEYFQKT